jgi:hypothetical protein
MSKSKGITSKDVMILWDFARIALWEREMVLMKMDGLSDFTGKIKMPHLPAPFIRA